MTKKPNNNDAVQVVEDNQVDAQLDYSVDTDPETLETDNKKHGSSPVFNWFLGAVVLLMRIVVGGVFMLSGFAKAIDPWGSYYKFNEYLMAFGWEELLSLSIVGAFVLAAMEFTLGVVIATGSCRRGGPIVSVLFLLFMTPLTFWLARTNAIPDCGCFGDLLVLDNWQTFYKNVMLLAGSLYLVFLNKKIPSLYGPAVQWVTMVLSCVLCLGLSVYGYFTQPLLDFRPYKVGTQLSSKSAPVSDDSYVFIYEKDGVQKEFALDSVPDDDSGWSYVDRRGVAQDSVAHDTPSIAVWDNGDDVSDELLSREHQILILLPELEKVNRAYSFLLNDLNDNAAHAGYHVAAITAASEEAIAAWNEMTVARYPIYTEDDSELKMIARGNPAIVLLNSGKVEWKRTLVSIDPDLIRDRSFPVDKFNQEYLPYPTLAKMCAAYLVAMGLLLAFNRTHVLLWKITKFIIGLFKRGRKDDDDGIVIEEITDATTHDKD
ncbi:MAG: DoxX family protein [Muribaculaceae bacterium]|nr:DoxX family protein [Muribaculaceae bacterium]